MAAAKMHKINFISQTTKLSRESRSKLVFQPSARTVDRNTGNNRTRLHKTLTPGTRRNNSGN